MKLGSWTIIIIGLALGLSALCYSYFQIYAPSEQAAAYNQDLKAKLELEANKQKQAENRLKTAMEMVQQKAQIWNQYVATRTPSSSLATGGINVFENPYQLVVDSFKYRNNAQREFNTQLHRGGVKIVSAPDIPIPADDEKKILADYYNWPAFSFPVVVWELGTVTVSGNYQQIMANVRSWATMPHYLAVTDGLRIDGTSPNLTASYNVTIVGFIRADKVFPAIPETGVVPASINTPNAGAPAGGAARRPGS